MGVIRRIRAVISAILPGEGRRIDEPIAPATQSAGRTGSVTDREIVTALRGYLGGAESVVIIGDARLVPRYFTIYLGHADYRRWTSIEVVRDTLARYLREQLAPILTELQGGTETIRADDIHVLLKGDDSIGAGEIDVSATIDEETGFDELPAPGDLPANDADLAGVRTLDPPPKPSRLPAAATANPRETFVMDSPEAERPSVRVELVVETAERRARYSLPLLPTAVGRATGDGVDIDDPGQHLSRRHLRFDLAEDDTVVVSVAENALNSTTVDGHVLPPGGSVAIADGARIEIANVRIAVRIARD